MLWLRKVNLITASRDRSTRAVALLQAEGVAEADLPETHLLERRLADRASSLGSIYGIWLVPAVGVVVALLTLTTTRFSTHSYFVIIMWIMFGTLLALADTDRRMYDRSVPHEATAAAAVTALEAITSPGTRSGGRGPGEWRGHTRNSAVCKAVDDLCAALRRRAEVEPRHADPVLRDRLREQAWLTVRNLHDAKVKALVGEEGAEGRLAVLLASILRRAVAPTNVRTATVDLVSPTLLISAPDWDGQARRRPSALAYVGSHGFFALLVGGSGLLFTLLRLPDAVVGILVAALAGAGHRLLRWLDLPAVADERRRPDTAAEPRAERERMPAA